MLQEQFGTLDDKIERFGSKLKQRFGQVAEGKVLSFGTHQREADRKSIDFEGRKTHFRTRKKA